MSCVKKKTQEQTLFDMFQTLKIEQYKKSVLQQRYLEVLRNFHIRARHLEIIFYTTRLIITIGSILVPAFLSIQGTAAQTQLYWATWIISLSVTISNGVMSLFKLDKKYFFINTTLEMLHSEGWQYIALSGRYSGKDAPVPATHDNQFLIFSHMAEKIKMRQVEEEYWKFTDTSGVGNATNQNIPLISPTPQVQQGQITSLPEPQKNVIEQWVGDMNSNMLGLQRRPMNISARVDGRQSGSKNSGISESPEETPVSMRAGLPTSSSPRETILPVSPFTTRGSEAPQNTVIRVLHEESDVWGGTKG
uniref:Uncharacterized protein n=1 Tax=viral metagenome TaxID=1070528 RepID=A0A6C0DIS7_9ZZZZ